MATSAETYSYETPSWAVITLCMAAVGIAAACLLGAYTWSRWADGAPGIVRWLLVLVGIVFAFAGLKPGNWKPWRYFVADASGLHFPSDCPETANTTWLVVPWSKVGEIRADRFHDRSSGVSMALQLTDEEIRRYFGDVAAKKVIFSEKVREGSNTFRVGYSNLFRDRDRAVAALNRLKASAR
jgi:hypothetical protein